MSKQKTIIVVAYPDRGAGNDPKLFTFYLFIYLFIYFFFGGGSFSPPRLNIFTVDNMGVMICLDQEGLLSLSASSFVYLITTFVILNFVDALMSLLFLIALCDCILQISTRTVLLKSPYYLIYVPIPSLFRKYSMWKEHTKIW